MEKLIKQAKTSKEAFLKLYNLYYPKLFSYLLVKTKNKELAEDIIQETFLKAMKAIKNLEYREHCFGAWLFKIASNELIDQYRKNSKVKKEEENDLELKLPHSPSGYDQLMEKENMVLEEERKKDLLWAINQLGEEEKNLIIFKYFSKLSYKEISVLLGKKPIHLAVQLHRALNKIKNILYEKNT